MITEIQKPSIDSTPAQTAVMDRPATEFRPEAVDNVEPLVDRLRDRRIKTAAHTAVKAAVDEIFPNPLAGRIEHADRVIGHTPTDTRLPKTTEPYRTRPQDLGRQK